MVINDWRETRTKGTGNWREKLKVHENETEPNAPLRKARPHTVKVYQRRERGGSGGGWGVAEWLEIRGDGGGRDQGGDGGGRDQGCGWIQEE